MAFTLLAVGFISWLIATLTAGGAGLIFLALATLLIPISLATVVLGIAGFIAGGYRVWLYKNDLSWPILKRLVPGTIIGATLGSALFSAFVASESLDYLLIFLAIVLVTSGVSGLLKLKTYGTKPKLIFFLPMGIFTGAVSGLVGAAGPIMNGLFQAFAVKPQQIVGTKSLNIFIQQMIKSAVYVMAIIFAADDSSFLEAGLELNLVITLSIVTAIGASAGVYAGRHILHKAKHEHFNTALNITMIFYGLHLAYPFLKAAFQG